MAQNKAPSSRAWLIPALLCILCWGVWGLLVKIGSDTASPEQLQILFTLGLLPLSLFMLFRLRLKVDRNTGGVIYGVLNGVFTGFGLLAYYAAMHRGKASVVGPVTGLFPLLTVALAFLVLRERLNRVQAGGVALALAAVVILSI
ncbi:MAG TPA: DMT family transporter [Bryobacteraceae bacterium]|jgi:uncharacterized membrane protein|nr:DMT family transporter [Bryobacteraceae bacterium]HWB99040.1 DMT family transporter [Bryobacteraceae bacterium]